MADTGDSQELAPLPSGRAQTALLILGHAAAETAKASAHAKIAVEHLVFPALITETML